MAKSNDKGLLDDLANLFSGKKKRAQQKEDQALKDSEMIAQAEAAKREKAAAEAKAKAEADAKAKAESERLAALAEKQKQEAAAKAQAEADAQRIAEFQQKQREEAAAKAKEAAKAAAEPLKVHRVKADETLSHIALRYYGNAAKPFWMLIYEANKDVIGDNPGIIREGQEFKIPVLPDSMK